MNNNWASGVLVSWNFSYQEPPTQCLVISGCLHHETWGLELVSGKSAKMCHPKASWQASCPDTDSVNKRQRHCAYQGL